MAYGQFTGYEPIAGMPGAYNFNTAGGKALTFGGPEAEQLKARLDAANAATTVAGDNAAPGFQVSGLAGRIREQGVQSGQQELGKLGGTVPEGAPAPGGPAAAAAPAQQGDGFVPHMENGINTGLLIGPDKRLYERVAATPGTKGGVVPVSQSQTVAGGFDPNEDYLEGRANARIDTRVAADKQREAELSAEEAGQQAAREQFAAAAGQVGEQQQLVNDVQAQVAAAQATRNQALKDYTGAKVDPERIFSGDFGAAKKGLSALAGALGAYGATVGHSQNFAQQIIDRRIAQDIGAQEVEIRTKKDAADNALSDLVRRGMSLDQARNTLGTIQRDYYKQQMQLARGASNSDLINAKYDAAMAQLDQQALDDDEKYRQQALGTATKTVQAKIVAPQAGSPGGLRLLTPDKTRQVASGSANTEGTVAGTASTLDKLESGDQKATPQKAKALAGVAASKAALLKFKEKWIKAGRPGVWNTGYFGSDISQELGADVDSLAPGLGRGLEGNAPNESTMKAIRSGLLASDPTKMASNIDAYLERLNETEKSLNDTKGDIGEEKEKGQ